MSIKNSMGKLGENNYIYRGENNYIYILKKDDNNLIK